MNSCELNCSNSLSRIKWIVWQRLFNRQTLRSKSGREIWTCWGILEPFLNKNSKIDLADFKISSLIYFTSVKVICVDTDKVWKNRDRIFFRWRNFGYDVKSLQRIGPVTNWKSAGKPASKPKDWYEPEAFQSWMKFLLWALMKTWSCPHGQAKCLLERSFSFLKNKRKAD